MDFIWKGAITRHRGFRAHGRRKRCENTTEATTPGASGPWGAAGGGAVVVFCCVFASFWPAMCSKFYTVLWRPFNWHMAIWL
eukprot:5894198-Heterocapsa_arctica.AAC.1